MALGSSIEWTDATWNPVTGCTKVSPGCKHCYAERMAHRLLLMGQPRYADGFRVTLQPDILELPLKWRLPRMIFVNSMSDLFHKDVPAEYIRRCFDVMQKASQHTFQILTKRPERASEMRDDLPWSPNIWMGTSVESTDYLSRVESLSKINAAVRFLSIEPLLGSIPNLPLGKIDWVIVGGESGPGAREMKEEWVVEIRDQCMNAEVPFFFKQWGGVHKSKRGRLLDDKEWNYMPHTRKEGTRAKRSVA